MKLPCISPIWSKNKGEYVHLYCLFQLMHSVMFICMNCINSGDYNSKENYWTKVMLLPNLVNLISELTLK